MADTRLLHGRLEWHEERAERPRRLTVTSRWETPRLYSRNITRREKTLPREGTREDVNGPPPSCAITTSLLAASTSRARPLAAASVGRPIAAASSVARIEASTSRVRPRAAEASSVGRPIAATSSVARLVVGTSSSSSVLRHFAAPPSAAPPSEFGVVEGPSSSSSEILQLAATSSLAFSSNYPRYLAPARTLRPLALSTLPSSS